MAYSHFANIFNYHAEVGLSLQKLDILSPNDFSYRVLLNEVLSSLFTISFNSTCLPVLWLQVCCYVYAEKFP